MGVSTVLCGTRSGVLYYEAQRQEKLDAQQNVTTIEVSVGSL